MSRCTRVFHLLSFSTVAALILFATGCAFSPAAAPTPQSGAALQGRIHGGQNPIIGAHIYLFAAGAGGYGGNGIAASAANASSSLLSASSTGYSDSVGAYVLTTAPYGNFSITGDWSCTAGQQLYLYALGGNTGAGNINSAAGLLAALGDCSTVNSSTYAFINEVSTIATAYALAGFATDATHISSSGTTLAAQGIKNAFLNVTNLETLNTGVALATTPVANGGNGAVPQTTINSLANIIAACINTTSNTSSQCSTLFSNAKSFGSSGTTATDTATAAINIAHNPGTNITALYNLGTPTPAFSPALSANPNDFTVGINFTGGGLSTPYALAIDASGNAWIANNAANAISKFSNLGAALSPTAGYTGGGLKSPYSIAIDSMGYAWVTNSQAQVISRFSSAGVPVSSSGYAYGNAGSATGIAVDGTGNIWTANGNSLAKFSSGGTLLSASTGYTGGGLFGAQSIAIDGTGNVWAANFANESLSKLTNSGVAVSSTSGYTGGGLYSPEPNSLAIDSTGNVWVATYSNTSNQFSGVGGVVKFSNAGAAISPSTAYTGGGLSGANGLAIDGANNIWITDEADNPGRLSELSSTGTALTSSTPYNGGSMYGSYATAIDGSGNAWVINYNNSLTELIGLAAPVITPLCAGLPSTPTANGTSNLGTRP